MTQRGQGQGIEAWHFLKDDRTLQHGHRGQERLLVEVGQTLTLPVSTAWPLVLCEYGLHASVRPLDALRYAPGAMICRVRLSGEILAPEKEDKLCASERTVLAMADATAVLHEFACWCAETAFDHVERRGNQVDQRSRAAIEAKRAWLRGEITDAELAAAWAATWAAAWDAAWDAARAAACAAAWDSAYAAAWAVAYAAAWDAAWALAYAATRAAAWDAAWAAAWAEMNVELERRLLTLLNGGKA